jgi:photosystem II stability/assembly factor-like uncharacterized protein
MVTRGKTLALVAGALVAGGCNGILGIDSHELAFGGDASAGMVGAAGADGGAEAGGAAVSGDAGPCSDGGWCRDYTPPNPDSLRSVWSSGPNDVWAVGDSGTILHRKGDLWTVNPGVPRHSLNAVSGTGPNDVWAVGQGTDLKGVALHWDGQKWSAVPSADQRLTAVWASGVWDTPSYDAWAVGQDGTILRWQPSQHAWMPFGGAGLPSLSAVLLTSVWGTKTGEVWIVGSNGTIVRWVETDRAWHDFTGASGSSQTLRQVWGQSSTDVWAVGDGGTILHWGPDSKWTNAGRGVTTQDLASVWGSVATNDISGTGGTPAYVWAVGAAGTILRLDGSTNIWSPVDSPSGTDKALHGVYGSGANDVLAVGDDDVRVQWDGGTWGIPASGFGDVILESIWGSASNDIWAAGAGGTIVHWNGTAWFIVESSETTGLTDVFLNHVWGNSENDVWAVGGGQTILHWDGTSWCNLSGNTCSIPHPPQSASLDYLSVWGSAANDVWIVESVGGGYLLHWGDDGWTEKNTPNGQPLSSVWGSAKDDVWAVGVEGTLLHFTTGPSWTDLSSSISTFTGTTMGNKTTLTGVWGGNGMNDVWIVGESELIIRLQRTPDFSFSVFPVSDPRLPAPGLIGVWSLGANNAWAVGEDGTILSFNGSDWRLSDSGIDRSYLNAVWARGTNDVWVVGTDGVILHH